MKRDGQHRTGPPSGVEPAGARCSSTFSGMRFASPPPGVADLQRQYDRPCAPRIGTQEKKKHFLPASRASITGSVKGSPNPARARTSHRSVRTRAAMGIPLSSAARRSGPRSPIMPTGVFCSCARTESETPERYGLSADGHEDTGRHRTSDHHHRRQSRVQRGVPRSGPYPGGRSHRREEAGRDYAKFLLSNERTHVARVGLCKMRVQRARELAARIIVGDHPLSEELSFRSRVAALDVELKALEILQMRAVAKNSHVRIGTLDLMAPIPRSRGRNCSRRHRNSCWKSSATTPWSSIGNFCAAGHPRRGARIGRSPSRPTASGYDTLDLCRDERDPAQYSRQDRSRALVATTSTWISI